MSNLLLVLGVLAAFVGPMALAWWLLGRGERRSRDGASRRPPRGKIPR